MNTQTTLHVTSVAIGLIYAVHAMQPKNKTSTACFIDPVRVAVPEPTAKGIN